jgi:hypothetical protein
MNQLELTKWLLKVRDALAEQDEVRRNSMLRAAEKLLNEQKQSRALHRVHRRMSEGNSPAQVVHPKQGFEPQARN